MARGSRPPRARLASGPADRRGLSEKNGSGRFGPYRVGPERNGLSRAGTDRVGPERTGSDRAIRAASQQRAARMRERSPAQPTPHAPRGREITQRPVWSCHTLVPRAEHRVQAWMRIVCRTASPAMAMSESVEEAGRRAGYEDREQLGPSLKETGVARDSEAEARGPEEGTSPRLGGGARRWKARTADSEHVERSVAHSCARVLLHHITGARC